MFLETQLAKKDFGTFNTSISADMLKQDKRYALFAAFKKGNLYNNNALVNEKGANPYWESGLCNPDEILGDLVKIFHPNLQPDYQLKYYKQLK